MLRRLVAFNKVLDERKYCKCEGGVEVSHCEEVEGEGVGGSQGKGREGREGRETEEREKEGGGCRGMEEGGGRGVE